MTLFSHYTSRITTRVSLVMLAIIIFSSSIVFADGRFDQKSLANEENGLILSGSTGIYKSQKKNYEITILKDLEYASIGDKSLKLDLYLPKNATSNSPVIVWVHGGAWERGSKTEINKSAIELVHSGFAVASVDYRLNYEAQFPAQLHDIKGSIRWLRANSRKYNLDQEKLGIWGSSAGAHLASLVGTTATIESLEGDVGGNTNYSSEVKFVINASGIYDFTDFDEDCKDTCGAVKYKIITKALEKLFNCNFDSNCESYKLFASPGIYISSDTANFFHIHSRGDNVIPSIQSVHFHEALLKNDIDSVLYIPPINGHGGYDQQYAKTIQTYIAEQLDFPL